MKLKKYFTIHETLKEKLSDDLAYSLVLDRHHFLLAVSCHNSKTLKFNHDKNIQSCMFTAEDLENDHKNLIDEIVRKYKEILVEKSTVEEKRIDPELEKMNKDFAANEGKIITDNIVKGYN